MQIIIVNLWLIFAATLNCLTLLQNNLVRILAQSTKPGSDLTILLVGFGLVLAVIVVVGLPFYMNYRQQIKPKEQYLENNINESKGK